MSTKSSNKDLDKIRSDFDKLFAFENQEEKIEADAKLLMAKFLSKIQEVTDEKDIKRKELAEMIGTSASYLTQLFRGHKIINLTTLAKIQNALDLEFDISLKGESKSLLELSDNDIEPFLNKWFKEKEGKGYMKIMKSDNFTHFPEPSDTTTPYKPTPDSYNLAV